MLHVIGNSAWGKCNITTTDSFGGKQSEFEGSHFGPKTAGTLL